jgi:PAS domain S-box-containing protein
MMPHSDHKEANNPQHNSPVTIFSSQPDLLSVRSGSLMKGESAKTQRQSEDTILVVNDMPELLKMMSLMLRQSGYHILTAFDGQEGFEVAQAEHPRLVISDVSMPRMDGIEMCRLIREHPSLRLTPILLVSAIRKDSESVIEGLKAGADDYLEAPYDPVSLIAKVARLLERRRAEESLQRSEERWRSLIENSSDIITILAIDGTIQYESPSVTRILGYQPEELVGKNVFEFIHPHDLPQVMKAFTRTFERGGISKNLEYRFRHQDGSWCVFESIGKTFRDESGELVGVVNSRDITERKRTKDALSQQQEILQKIFDHIPVMISFWDAQGRLKLVNQEWERVIGWTLEEIEKQNLDVVAECYPDPQYRRRVLALLTSSGGEWMDFKPRVRDGRVICTSWAAVHLSDGTSITIGQDITERKRADERLKSSNEKLRALAAHLQSVREEESISIAREIHDELGGALTGLKMDLSWLARRLPETLDEAVRQHLKSMSDYIDETIQKVRNISTGLRPSVLDDLGLAAAIEWQTREFQNRTEIKCEMISLQEEVALSPEKSTAVFRIFQEILTNIARHARATLVQISMKQDDGDLLLKVSDNGLGIAESDITDTTSLGILGMRERTVVFGGEVEINGEAGRGTTVMVRIPYK